MQQLTIVKENMSKLALISTSYIYSYAVNFFQRPQPAPPTVATMGCVPMVHVCALMVTLEMIA